jgi:hypothetical protein
VVSAGVAAGLATVAVAAAGDVRPFEASQGSILWQREFTSPGEDWIVKENAYGGPKYDRATDLAPAAGGGFVLAGMTESFGAGKRDILLLKVDGNGIEQWRRIYGEPGNDAASPPRTTSITASRCYPMDASS